MTRLLIAVLSCQRDRMLGHHETIRQRWGVKLSDVGEVRFFVGGQQPQDLLADEIWLNVPDGYQELTLKTKAICDWVLAQGYDFIFKCDCDTSIRLNRFRAFNYERFDYAGRFYGGGPGIKWSAAMGPGYFLSKKACEIVSKYEYPVCASEDQMVGDALYPHIVEKRIKAHHVEESVYSAVRGFGEPHEPGKAI